MKCSELLRFQCYAILIWLCTWWYRNGNSSKLGCLCLLLEHLEDPGENVWKIYFAEFNRSSSFKILIRTWKTVLPALSEESEVFYFALPDRAECLDIIISKATKLNAKALWIAANFKLSNALRSCLVFLWLLRTPATVCFLWTEGAFVWKYDSSPV